MEYNTALGAGSNEITQNITFRSEKHKKFYLEYLPKCRYKDVYHKALVYCLGIGEDTRNNIDAIYDFKTGYVKTECLRDGWITSGSARIVRMAFNLYCNGTPSVHDYGNEPEEALSECRKYAVEELFCCGYATYFWEAIKAVKAAYGAEMNIFEDAIPRSEAIAEIASEGISIFEYDKRSKGAESYERLAQEVLNHA